MNTINERNQRITYLLNSLYEKAENTELEVDESNYKDSIEKLFNTNAWGFREILLVVIVAMMLDSTYCASTALYNCNPRAIYEGPIKEFLIEKNIPHRKSGPLNVAKATVGLDMSWAAQRRPSDVAKQVVKIVNYLEADFSKRETRVKSVGISLMRRLINCSNYLEKLSVKLEPSSDPVFLYHLCRELITKAPDAGNTPQRIVAYLLKNYHKSLHTNIIVTGEDDRASVTSTTSQKPGDVNEESKDGVIFKVYEVTVKPFDIARIRDSYDCVRIYNENNNTNIHEIIVICRPEDCPVEIESSGLQGYLGSFEFQDIIYYYLNIFEWISSTLQRMTSEGRSSFHSNLNDYINEINTAEKVKILWNELHNQ